MNSCNYVPTQDTSLPTCTSDVFPSPLHQGLSSSAERNCSRITDVQVDFHKTVICVINVHACVSTELFIFAYAHIFMFIWTYMNVYSIPQHWKQIFSKRKNASTSCDSDITLVVLFWLLPRVREMTGLQQIHRWLDKVHLSFFFFNYFLNWISIVGSYIIFCLRHLFTQHDLWKLHCHDTFIISDI